MLLVLGIVAPVFGLILLGWIAGRRKLVPGGDPVASLNGFVVWFALPALLFQAVAEAKPADLAHGGFLLAFSGGVAATFLLALLARGRALADRSLDALAASYANTAYIGIPLGTAAFGPPGLTAAVLASLVTVSALFALSVLLVEIDRHRGRGLGRTMGRVVAGVLRNPMVAAPLLGGVWRLSGTPVPGPLHAATALLGAAASPCALVTIGLFLAVERPPAPRRPLARILLLKLLLQPAVTALIAFPLIGLSPPWGAAAVLLAACPTGTGPFMLAELYGRDGSVTAGAILLSTLAAVATTSLLLLGFAAH